MEVFIEHLKKQKNIVPERDFPPGVYTYSDGTIFVYHPDAHIHMVWTGKNWMGPSLVTYPPWIYNIGPIQIQTLDFKIKQRLMEFTSCARDPYLENLWIKIIENH